MSLHIGNAWNVTNAAAFNQVNRVYEKSTTLVKGLDSGTNIPV